MEKVMIQQITVEHVTFVTDRPFDAVLRAFEERVGSLEEMGWAAIPAASRDQADFEHRVKEVLGPSGFTRFQTIDHGEWLAKHGRHTRFILYTIGNPLIAITMIKHHIEVGLDVPVRLAIYEDPDGKTRLVFNKPSSLMSGLGNEAVHSAALKLDAKMMALGEAVTGAQA
jgi:uncharacterized protein (DUF302 family)